MAKTLEENFEAIEDLLEKLEDPALSIDNSFKLYNDGMKLLKQCNDTLDKIETKLIILDDEQVD